ncbi:MAG: hypothetical protein LBC58_06460 [Clostridiales Family XIII bacterium]|jgi:hypothetical protein|nr:hypothetical protein [Clostridiales Family XIII bacterium]
MAAGIAGEAALMLALAAEAVWDMRKREVCRPVLFLIALVGVVMPGRGFIMQSAAVLAAFCALILVKKTDIGIGGGDIWVLVALTFATGVVRALSSLTIGVLALITANAIRFGRAGLKRETALIPFIAAGHVATLLILSAVISA